jgi:cbb3-type cytochrome oxidase subunit 1
MNPRAHDNGRILGARLLKIAVAYLLTGMIGGIVMGATHQFQYSPVHAHVNLLGWATLAITGLVYHAYPELSGHWLARAHAWLHNIGLALMMLGLTFVMAGHQEFLPVVMVGSLVVTAGVLLFAVNLFTRLSPSSEASPLLSPENTMAN